MSMSMIRGKSNSGITYSGIRLWNQKAAIICLCSQGISFTHADNERAGRRAGMWFTGYMIKLEN